jgi:MFS family permease
MIFPSQNTTRPPRLRPTEAKANDPAPPAPARPTPADSPYGRHFWFAYVANTLAMMAVALLFRYADFILLLGGDEFHLGWIVGVGMVGSLFMRVALGSWIDRYGARRVWLGALLLFAACCFAHLAVDTYRGPAVYLLRIGYCSAVAGIFGSSMTFVSGRAVTSRMAEMIGMLGTAGFVGMVLGTQLGDLLLGTKTIEPVQVDRMFLTAGSLALAALGFVWAATGGQKPPQRRRRPPLVALLRRYHPGGLLLVGITMGIALGLPSIFLRTYTEQLGIDKIGVFFGVYAPTALVTRVLTRRLPERFGCEPMILVGLGCLVFAQLLFLHVGDQWQLLVPGAVYGMGHAILFPAVTAAASSTFPDRYRGLGTTVALGSFDLGQLIGAPVVGTIVHASKQLQLPAYPALFITMAGFLAVVAATFGWSMLRRRRAVVSRSEALAMPRPRHRDLAGQEPAWAEAKREDEPARAPVPADAPNRP